MIRRIGRHRRDVLLELLRRLADAEGSMATDGKKRQTSPRHAPRKRGIR